MTDERLYTLIMNLARNDGAIYPTLAEADSEGTPIIVDTDSGRTWKVELREF